MSHIWITRGPLPSHFTIEKIEFSWKLLWNYSRAKRTIQKKNRKLFQSISNVARPFSSVQSLIGQFICLNNCHPLMDFLLCSDTYFIPTQNSNSTKKCWCDWKLHAYLVLYEFSLGGWNDCVGMRIIHTNWNMLVIEQSF